MPPLHPPRHHHHERRTSTNITTTVRLNKFVRRLHEMLSCENGRGVVEWRRGVLVLHSINTIFAKEILPKYFGTQNFKTFRRQLNYYGKMWYGWNCIFFSIRKRRTHVLFSMVAPYRNLGFLHVRSFSASGSTSTALWVNKELADGEFDSIASVLRLKRVESSNNDSTKVSPEAREKKKIREDHRMEIACDVPNVVRCQQQGSDITQYDGLQVASCVKEENLYIAAGLLLSLADAAT